MRKSMAGMTILLAAVIVGLIMGGTLYQQRDHYRQGVMYTAQMLEAYEGEEGELVQDARDNIMDCSSLKNPTKIYSVCYFPKAETVLITYAQWDRKDVALYLSTQVGTVLCRTDITQGWAPKWGMNKALFYGVTQEQWQQLQGVYLVKNKENDGRQPVGDFSPEQPQEGQEVEFSSFT